MSTVSSTNQEFRHGHHGQRDARPFPLIGQVNGDHAPIEITSKKGSAVLMSMEDYEALQETAHLLRNPANAAHPLKSIGRSMPWMTTVSSSSPHGITARFDSTLPVNIQA